MRRLDPASGQLLRQGQVAFLDALVGCDLAPSSMPTKKSGMSPQPSRANRSVRSDSDRLAKRSKRLTWKKVRIVAPDIGVSKAHMSWAPRCRTLARYSAKSWELVLACLV